MPRRAQRPDVPIRRKSPIPKNGKSRDSRNGRAIHEKPDKRRLKPQRHQLEHFDRVKPSTILQRRLQAMFERVSKLFMRFSRK